MKKQAGFTLIETLISIFILTLTVGGLLTLAANGYFSVRYARNQIVADNLLQESLEYVRNSRDTGADQNETWAQWVAGLNTGGCFNTGGCIVDPYSSNGNFRPFTGQQIAFYPDTGFYGYATSSYPAALTGTTAPSATTYTRVIIVQQAGDPNQLIVNSTVYWQNGIANQHNTQSILITNWHNQ